MFNGFPSVQAPGQVNPRVLITYSLFPQGVTSVPARPTTLATYTTFPARPPAGITGKIIVDGPLEFAWSFGELIGAG
jgi:hypothetical protein